MPFAGGLGASIGIAAETTVGTQVTPDRWYEWLDASPQLVPTYVDGMGIKVGQAYKRASRTIITAYDVNGDITMEHPDRGFDSVSGKGMGLWWKHAVGSTFTTPVVIGATTAYRTILTPGASGKVGLGLTLQAGWPESLTQTVKPYCVDEQTEILTQRGWITHHSLDESDVVLSLDPESREVCWEPVISVHRFDHDGPLVRWKSQRMDALTTPNHRWLVETKRRAVAGGTTAFLGEPAFRTTEELANRYDYIITGGGTPACFAAAPVYTDEFVELIGWVVTEGHYQTQVGSYGVLIAQDTAVNPGYAARIRALAAHFRADGATVSEYMHSYDGTRAHWYFGKGICRAIRTAAPQRQLTPEFLCSLTLGQARLLYQTLVDGDGTRRAPRMSKGIRRAGGAPTEVWTQKDQGRVDGFQMLAAMLGKRTWAHPDRDFQSVSVHRDTHCVGKTMPSREEDYLGVVWCPRTRTGTWLARRNGCTYWTGNTYRGGKITGWEFTCQDGSLAQVKFTLDAWQEDRATGLTAPVFPTSGQSLFGFADATIFTLGGTATTTSGLTTVASGVQVASICRGITITCATPLDDARRGLGSGGVKAQQFDNGIPTLTGSIDAEFTSQAELYNLFANNTTTVLDLSFRHGDAGGGNPYELRFTFPAVKFKTGQVKPSGPALLSQTIGFEAYDDGSGTNPPYQVLLVSKDQAL